MHQKPNSKNFDAFSFKVWIRKEWFFKGLCTIMKLIEFYCIECNEFVFSEWSHKGPKSLEKKWRSIFSLPQVFFISTFFDSFIEIPFWLDRII